MTPAPVTMATTLPREYGQPQSTSEHQRVTEHSPHHQIFAPNTKGLLNAPGQNNCFLNSAVQVSFKFFFYLFIYFLKKTLGGTLIYTEDTYTHARPGGIFFFFLTLWFNTHIEMSFFFHLDKKKFFIFILKVSSLLVAFRI
jgi:hypothetical protein